MRHPIWFELKKTLSVRKLIVLSATIVVLCRAIFVFIQFQADYEYIKEVQNQYAGVVTDGAVAESVARYEELLEIDKTVGLSHQQKEEFLSLETPVWLNRCDEVRKERLAEYGITPSTIVIGDTISYGFMENFISRFFPLIICFIISFLIGPVFTTEYENKMDGLLLATKNGKRKVIISKLFASFIITILAHIVIIMVFMIQTIAAYGIGDLDASFVFTAGDPFTYITSPFDYTVLQYVIVMLAVSLLGCIGYCVFALFISSKCKHSAVSSMICMAIAFVPFLTYLTVGNEQAPITNILRFTYSQIISVRTLCSTYCTVSIGNFEFQSVYLSLLLLCVLSVGFTILTYRTFRSHQVEN